MGCDLRDLCPIMAHPHPQELRGHLGLGRKVAERVPLGRVVARALCRMLARGFWPPGRLPLHRMVRHRIVPRLRPHHADFRDGTKSFLVGVPVGGVQFPELFLG